MRRIDNISMDLIADDQGMVLFADLIHFGQLFPGPYPAYRVGRITHQEDPHFRIRGFSFQILKIDLIMPVL